MSESDDKMYQDKISALSKKIDALMDKQDAVRKKVGGGITHPQVAAVYIEMYKKHIEIENLRVEQFKKELADAKKRKAAKNVIDKIEVGISYRNDQVKKYTKAMADTKSGIKKDSTKDENMKLAKQLSNIVESLGDIGELEKDSFGAPLVVEEEEDEIVTDDMTEPSDDDLEDDETNEDTEEEKEDAEKLKDKSEAELEKESEEDKAEFDEAFKVLEALEVECNKILEKDDSANKNASINAKIAKAQEVSDKLWDKYRAFKAKVKAKRAKKKGVRRTKQQLKDDKREANNFNVDAHKMEDAYHRAEALVQRLKDSKK